MVYLIVLSHVNVIIINPWRACVAGVTVLGLCVSLSVCLSVIMFSATTPNKAAKKRYQQVQWLDLKNFLTSTAFKSYSVKTKWTRQYAIEHNIPQASCEHGGSIRSHTNGKYVIQLCLQHYYWHIAGLCVCEKLYCMACASEVCNIHMRISCICVLMVDNDTHVCISARVQPICYWA